jgi:predicted regulator of Ras-like GTPase activity (Roadblock/LC7/MglB family)
MGSKILVRDRQERLDQLLGELGKVHGVQGASLVSRDGLTVRSVGKHELSRETFSAMSATLMGAAEIALGELDATRARYVVAQTQRLRMIVLGATPDLLLVVLVSADVKLEDIVPRAESAAASVATLVAG